MPIGWIKMGFLCHIGEMYGIKTALRDVFLSNIASLLASYGAYEEIMQGVADTPAGEKSEVHPAVNWSLEFHFLMESTGMMPEEIARRVGTSRGPEKSKSETAYKRLYRALADAERPAWEKYLRDRVGDKGWNGETLEKQLRRLPRTMPGPPLVLAEDSWRKTYGYQK